MNRVLVVNDNEADRKLLEAILEKERYEVETCAGGREACQKLRVNSYNLIISDEEMPPLGGAELAVWVKERPELAQIPFILIGTSSGSSDLGDLIERNIINCFIPKPYQISQLIRLAGIFISQGKRN